MKDAGGDRRICRTRWHGPDHHLEDGDPNLIDHKLDLLSIDLRKYDIGTCDGYTFLHLGRLRTSNEVVWESLDARASEAWKEAGEVWEAISPRIMTAHLKIVRRGQGRRKTCNSFIRVISV